MNRLSIMPSQVEPYSPVATHDEFAFHKPRLELIALLNVEVEGKQQVKVANASKEGEPEKKRSRVSGAQVKKAVEDLLKTEQWATQIPGVNG